MERPHVLVWMRVEFQPSGFPMRSNAKRIPLIDWFDPGSVTAMLGKYLRSVAIVCPQPYEIHGRNGFRLPKFTGLGWFRGEIDNGECILDGSEPNVSLDLTVTTEATAPARSSESDSDLTAFSNSA